MEDGYICLELYFSASRPCVYYNVVLRISHTTSYIDNRSHLFPHSYWYVCACIYI